MSINSARVEVWLGRKGCIPKLWYEDWPHWGPIVQRYRHAWIDQMVQLLEEET